MSSSIQSIYKPKGRAGEYAELALNLYRGCSHGCTYCYVKTIPGMAEGFDKPRPKSGILNAIEQTAPDFSGKSVFLCFACDPYQHIDVEHQLTREAIKILHNYGLAVRILTKGGHRSTRDFDLLWKKGIDDESNIDAYGATLTFWDSDLEHKYEPSAAPNFERVHALEEAHERGIYTWASLEPVIDPRQTLRIIEETHEIVDEYKIGKWNHDRKASKIDWKSFVREAVALLKGYSKKYYLKRGLHQYITSAKG